MKSYDVIVIGAGNGGLTAAASLSQKGISTLMLERHNIPGGCATSFCRGRFEFEVALHQLSGLGTPDKPGPLRLLLDKLEITNELEFVEIPELYNVVMPDGFKVALQSDREQVVSELQQLFPREKDAIKAFMDLVYNFAENMVGAFVFRDPEPSREKYPFLYKYAFKNTKSILDDYFRDPVLKAVLSAYWGYVGIPPERLAFIYLAMLLFTYIEFKPFHIKGGSQRLSNALLNKFISNGGEALFNCGVKQITTDNGAVKGIITANDEEIAAKHIISNVSPVATYLRLMDTKVIPEAAVSDMRGRHLSPSALTMFIGFDCEPQDLGFTETTNFILSNTDITEAPLESMRRIEVDDELMVVSCYDVADPGFSAPGTCQANVVTLKYGEPWLKIPPRQYAEVKNRCAAALLRRVEEVFPNVKKHIEEFEVGTPLTHMRYLGHPHGAIYGYENQTKDSLFFQPGRYSPIQGLSFVGGWTGDPGFEPTLRSGRRAAKAIINQLGAA
jgi:prolycopene isomerase